MAWSLPGLKKGGTLVIVGYVPGHPVPIDTMAMHYNEWILKGARLCTKAELLQVINLIEGGKLRPVISKTFPFEKANEASGGSPEREYGWEAGFNVLKGC